MKTEIKDPIIEKGGKFVQKSILNLLGKFKGPYMVFVVLCFIVFILGDILKINNVTGTWIFFSQGNIVNVVNQVAMNAIIAFGMTLIIIILGIDLSAGSMVALIGVSFVGLYMNLKVSFVVALLITLAIGLLMGLMNGVIVAKIKIPAFIVTLGTMTLFRGISLVLVNGKPIFCDNPALIYIGNGFVGPLPFTVIILIVMFAFFYYLLAKTKFGRYVYAIGGNEETAVLSGINVARVKIWVYVLGGFSCVVSGLILASRLGSGQPSIGEGYEMDAITAAIIGGASLSGGAGTITGTLAGALIIGVINNGMNILGISPYLQLVVKGAVILGSVILDITSHSKD